MIAMHYFPIMTQPSDPGAALGAEIIIHLARLAQSGGDARLTAAQWTALRYFARANRLSRTPSAFSAFHATTRGTASQTVKSLVALGLLEGHRSAEDGRSTRFDLTDAGRRMLRDDPLHALTAVLDRLAPGDRAHLLGALQTITAQVAAEQSAPVFGTCADCSHCDAAADPAFCRCAEAMLLASEMDALCISFAPRGGARATAER